jgi:hypothetical protein
MRKGADLAKEVKAKDIILSEKQELSGNVT